MLSGLIAAALAAAAPPLPLLDAAGRSVAPARPGVVLFWRGDCAPCRLELSERAALARAAAPLPLQWVELDAPGRREGAAVAGALLTPEPAARVLGAWGGEPPRLPLAVALDAGGRVCARHTGLLGTDRLRAWARACGGARAGR